MTKIAILAPKNCMKSSVTGPFDILSVASLEWKRIYPETTEKLFDIVIVTYDGLPTTCFLGTTIQPHYGIDECKDLDIVFIPVISGNLDNILSNKALVTWLIQQNKSGTTICAVCAGVFLAAQTGLLNKKKATTHWGLAADFQKRYPAVTLMKEKMIVDEGNFITAGGVTAYMDLSLYLAGRLGSPELISTLSKLLLIDPARRLQTPYKNLAYNTAHDDQDVAKAQQWMKKNIKKTISLTTLANTVGLGERTLIRRFKKATGNPPIEYLQNLRVGKARTSLETTDKTFDAITYEVGYEDVSSFRRLFKKATGLSPSAYRKRFSLN